MDWTQFAPKDGENVLSEEEQAYIKAYFKNRATESVKQTLATIYSVNDKVSKELRMSVISLQLLQTSIQPSPICMIMSWSLMSGSHP